MNSRTQSPRRHRRPKRQRARALSSSMATTRTKSSPSRVPSRALVRPQAVRSSRAPSLSRLRAWACHLARKWASHSWTTRSALTCPRQASNLRRRMLQRKSPLLHVRTGSRSRPANLENSLVGSLVSPSGRSLSRRLQHPRLHELSRSRPSRSRCLQRQKRRLMPWQWLV